MNLKIQCHCGTKFSFDVEPVEGRMPVEIFCPKCGADATETANQMIAQTPGRAVVAEPAPLKPRIHLHVTKPASSVVAESETAGGIPAVEMCHRHVKNPAVEHCVVCKKPICPECMQSFGYLCSVGCRYRADQEKIRVPIYKLQKNALEKSDMQKYIAITASVALVLCALIGAWFWFITVGDKPHVFYSLPVSTGAASYARFLRPNQILLLGQRQIALHDVKLKKDVWSTKLDDPLPALAAKSGAAVPMADDEIFPSDFFMRPDPYFHEGDLWLCLSHNVVGINLKTGAVKQTVPFQGQLAAFTPGESTLLVVSEREPPKKIVTQINLSSGEVKTEEVQSSLREKVSTSRDLPSTVLPTAALLLKRELAAEKTHEPSIYKFSSEFFPAGQNLVEMQVKLLEAKQEAVQTIKPAGPSHLNQDTRASTSVRSVAEETFNEMKRNSTGGYKLVDISRYAVLLRRTMETGTTDWSGETDGLPVFFPQKTVDVLVAGKTLFLFDKQNKKIAEAHLAFPIADDFTADFIRADQAPCVETNGTLYFFDKGGLTAFAVSDGTVRWRLPSVGISEIQFDEKGMLYVSTTTGAPEDIQYSEQIKMNDAPQPIVLKVDPKLGKTLWKCDQSGGGLFLTGKYVYLTDAARGGFSMVHAVEQAFGTAQEAGNFRVIRINPANGKKIWAFVKKGAPSNIDFAANRILLQYGTTIQLMKFLSF